MRSLILFLVVSLMGCEKPVASDPLPVTGAAAATSATPLEGKAKALVANPDFRNASWGLSRADVGMDGEILDSGLQDVVVLFSAESCTVAGLQCKAVYYFYKDELAQGRFLITEEHSNKTAFITDFNNLVEKLTVKYGTPTKQDTIWVNNLYKDDPADWGMAVSIGHMMKVASWTTDRTQVVIGLTGDNYHIVLALEYHSLAHQSQLDAAVNQAATSGL